MDPHTPSVEIASAAPTTLYDAIAETQPELMATLKPEIKEAIHQFDDARQGLHEAIENRGKRPPAPAPAYHGSDIRNIRQAKRRVARGGPLKGKKRQPSVKALYGDLERQGHVRIIRKKGRPPEIKFLPQD